MSERHTLSQLLVFALLAGCSEKAGTPAAETVLGGSGAVATGSAGSGHSGGRGGTLDGGAAGTSNSAGGTSNSAGGAAGTTGPAGGTSNSAGGAASTTGPAGGTSSAAPCARATTLFCDDFEGGSFDAWDDYDGNPAPGNTIVREPGPHNVTENHVARLLAATGSTSGVDLTKVMPHASDRLYLRYYQKFESGFDFSALNHAGGGPFANRNSVGSSDNRPTGSDFIWSILEFDSQNFHLYSYYRGMYQDCVDPNGQCWGDHLPCTSDEGSNYCTKAEHRDTVPVVQPQANKWYCMEVMVDLGAAVQSDALAMGRQDFWIDGVSQGPFEHLWFRTTPDLLLGGVWISSYFHHGQGNSSGILYDEVVVSTERIGCN